MARVLPAAVEAMEPGWIYFGKGYGNKYAQLDYNSKDVALFGELEKIGDALLDEAAIAGVREICSYCADHDIELIVVNVPIPVFNIHGYGQFYVDSQQAVSDMLADMALPIMTSSTPNPTCSRSRRRTSTTTSILTPWEPTSSAAPSSPLWRRLMRGRYERALLHAARVSRDD